MRSSDHGATWTAPQRAKLASGTPEEASYGSSLASGIALRRGPHAGRLLVALRHDCCEKVGGSGKRLW